ASRCGGGPSQCRWHSQGRRHGTKSRFQRPHGYELHRHRRRPSHGRQHRTGSGPQRPHRRQQGAGPWHLQHEERRGRVHDRGQGIEGERHQAQGRRDPGCSGRRNIPHAHRPLAVTRLGEGTGTRHLLTHGMHSDYAVCADGSDMNIVWTQTGVVQAKITTFGKAEAAWGTNRPAYPMEKVNAIVKMTKIIDALERWGAEFEQKHIYNSPTGPLLPKVNIGAIEGGAPYRPNYFPGVCSIYVDVRIPPHVRPVSLVTRE